MGRRPPVAGRPPRLDLADLGQPIASGAVKHRTSQANSPTSVQWFAGLSAAAHVGFAYDLAGRDPALSPLRQRHGGPPGPGDGLSDLCRDGQLVGAPAPVPRLRPHRLLRQQPEPSRDRPRPRDGARPDPIGTAGRAVGLVLPGRGIFRARRRRRLGGVRGVARRQERVSPGFYPCGSRTTPAGRPGRTYSFDMPPSDSYRHGVAGWVTLLPRAGSGETALGMNVW